MNKPIGPETRRVRRGNGVFYEWRHPSVRDGEWSRRYISRNAAVTGMALTLWHARQKRADAFDAKLRAARKQ